jgi:hypothetical protein
VTHRMLVLSLVTAAAVIGLSACSSQSPGSAVGDSSTSSAPTTTAGSTSGSGGGGSPLASVDPCTLIAQSEVANNGLQPGQTVQAPGGRECRWERPDDGATIDGYLIQIAIYDTAGIDKLNTAGGTVTDYTVGKYQGKLFQDTPLNACIISLPTSNTSRVDIDVISRLGIAKGCDLVKEVAPHVTPQFPAGS